jgi:acetyltransferase-like isoleucine patch superfamily enzyme
LKTDMIYTRLIMSSPRVLKIYNTYAVLTDEGVWIGYGAVMLKGASIGKHSVVGACSVVHTPVPDNTVVAGNPARVIKKLG